MPQIGPLEILIVGALALIVLGPEKLPEMARSVGRFMTEMRRMASEVKSEFDAGLEDDEPVADEATDDIEEAAPEAAPEAPKGDDES